MFKKITTIISTNKSTLARKAIFMGSLILGIGVGLLLDKDDDMVIVEERVGPEEEVDQSFEDSEDESVVED